jgi:hypothetical protein
MFVACLWFPSLFKDFHIFPLIVNECKICKTSSYVFSLFTPLSRGFRLSRVPQTIHLEVFDRLLSKMLHFITCGLALGRFCVYDKTFMASVSKIYRTSIELKEKFDRTSIDFRYRGHESLIIDTKTAQRQATSNEMKHF